MEEFEKSIKNLNNTNIKTINLRIKSLTVEQPMTYTFNPLITSIS